jgi:hypothetical protein
MAWTHHILRDMDSVGWRAWSEPLGVGWQPRPTQAIQCAYGIHLQGDKGRGCPGTGEGFQRPSLGYLKVAALRNRMSLQAQGEFPRQAPVHPSCEQRAATICELRGLHNTEHMLLLGASCLPPLPIQQPSRIPMQYYSCWQVLRCIAAMPAACHIHVQTISPPTKHGLCTAATPAMHSAACSWCTLADLGHRHTPGCCCPDGRLSIQPSPQHAVRYEAQRVRCLPARQGLRAADSCNMQLGTLAPLWCAAAGRGHPYALAC